MADVTDDFLIWWVNPSDINRTFLIMPDLHGYVLRQLISAEGRNGRGRLWADQSFSEIAPDHATWNDSNPICKAAADSAGIVIHSNDARWIVALPGFITDFMMRLSPPCPVTDDYERKAENEPTT